MICDLLEQWRVRAGELAPYAPAAAEAFRRAAEELERELVSVDDGITLAEAAAIGGYSIDHLQRLVSSGQLANVGRKHRPRIRTSDVPRKPGHGLQSAGDDGHFSDRRRIAASVLTETNT